MRAKFDAGIIRTLRMGCDIALRLHHFDGVFPGLAKG